MAYSFMVFYSFCVSRSIWYGTIKLEQRGNFILLIEISFVISYFPIKSNESEYKNIERSFNTFYSNITIDPTK